MTNRRAVSLVAVLLVLVLAGWIVYQAVRDDRSGSDVSGTSGTSWQQSLVKRGEAELNQAGGLPPLGGPLGETEAVPRAMRRRIAQNLEGVEALHLHYAKAHLVRTSVGVGIWIVEGNGVTCIFFHERSPSSACKTSLGARRHGIGAGTYTTSPRHPGQPTGFLALGVVPPDIRAVALDVDGSPAITIPISNGTWAMRARRPIHLVRLVR